MLFQQFSKKKILIVLYGSVGGGGKGGRLMKSEKNCCFSLQIVNDFEQCVHKQLGFVKCT